MQLTLLYALTSLQLLQFSMHQLFLLSLLHLLTLSSTKLTCDFEMKDYDFQSSGNSTGIHQDRNKLKPDRGSAIDNYQAVQSAVHRASSSSNIV